MKLISFALYGTNPLYFHGMVRNIALAAEYFPDWMVRVYCARELAAPLRVTAPAVRFQVVKMAPPPVRTAEGMKWRLAAANDPDVSHVIFRDADSRLSAREARAVRDWVDSGATAHMIRDHPHHAHLKLSGGLWGVRGGVLKSLPRLLRSADYTHKGSDSKFLSTHIWPLVSHDILIHGVGGHTLPPRVGDEFIGQIVTPGGRALPAGAEDDAELAAAERAHQQPTWEHLA